MDKCFQMSFKTFMKCIFKKTKASSHGISKNVIQFMHLHLEGYLENGPSVKGKTKSNRWKLRVVAYSVCSIRIFRMNKLMNNKSASKMKRATLEGFCRKGQGEDFSGLTESTLFLSLPIRLFNHLCAPHSEWLSSQVWVWLALTYETL